MDSQERTSNVQPDDTSTAVSSNSIDAARQPWQMPTVTSLEIKRTMNSSGQFSDGETSHNVRPT